MLLLPFLRFSPQYTGAVLSSNVLPTSAVRRVPGIHRGKERVEPHNASFQGHRDPPQTVQSPGLGVPLRRLCGDEVNLEYNLRCSLERTLAQIKTFLLCAQTCCKTVAERFMPHCSHITLQLQTISILEPSLFIRAAIVFDHSYRLRSIQETTHFNTWLPRLASHRVWDGASDGIEEDGEGLAEGSKDETEDEVQRSGKLLVLQQILPLWHAQVGITGQKVTQFGGHLTFICATPPPVVVRGSIQHYTRRKAFNYSMLTYFPAFAHVQPLLYIAESSGSRVLSDSPDAEYHRTLREEQWLVIRTLRWQHACRYQTGESRTTVGYGVYHA